MVLDLNNREGLSDVQVFRNFLNALQKANWNIDFQNPNGQVTGHNGSDYVFMDNMNAGFCYQTIIPLKEMQQEVVADGAAFDNVIKQSGHVAVYGIHLGCEEIAYSKRGTTVVTVRRERRGTSVGATPTRELVRSTR